MTTPLAGMQIHPDRATLVEELHARPPLNLPVPARVTHLALVDQPSAERQQGLAALCQCYDLQPPPAETRLWVGRFPDFQLRWERHTEFSSYTFFSAGLADVPFSDRLLDRLPADWLATLPGTLLVAVELLLESRGTPARDSVAIHRLFGHDNLVVGQVAGGSALVWTDFRLDSHGFGRLLVRDVNLIGDQAGRVVQQLLEIETYRLLALLAFPLAQDVGESLTRAEAVLHSITNELPHVDPGSERPLFERLSHLAGEVEALAARSNYRFGAARAYYTLVQHRLADLDERSFRGGITLGAFLERRLAPAMRTCESVSERLASLSLRVNRASDLLRTRVDLSLETQNRDLLASMNRRARLQLRLQQTVEGLSVVVLSTYLLQLLGYALQGVATLVPGLNISLIQAVAIPGAVLIAWWLVRQLRRGSQQHTGDS